MSTCCKTCDHRNDAVHAFPSGPTELDVCFITLTFKSPFSTYSSSGLALNAVLNNIIDSEATSSHPSTFTSWSPCLTDPHNVVIVSTARETCGSAKSPVFVSLSRFLAEPPRVQHIYSDYSIMSLAASSPQSRVPIDIIQLQAPNPGVAATIGKHFGWDPKRSLLSLQMESCATAAFSRPGDLIKDFRAWAELGNEGPISPSTVYSSFASSSESLSRHPPLRTFNSDEKNMSLPFPDEEDEGSEQQLDDETLIMVFQWSSHADADRFKHPLQASYGQNGSEVSKDLWDRQVAHPVRQLQALGAKTETYKLELRPVEPRIELCFKHEEKVTSRARSGSKRLSMMASGLGEKVSGLWR